MAVKALGELENIWQMPEPYKHLNRITPLIEQVQNVNHQLVEQHQHALERIDARIEESRQRLQEAHATSELQNSVLLPMQSQKTCRGQPVNSGNSGGTARSNGTANGCREED